MLRVMPCRAGAGPSRCGIASPAPTHATRPLSDREWADIAAEIMHQTGLAPRGDDFGVRWVAIRHATDHIHLVATLARHDGRIPSLSNDYYKLAAARRIVETRYGLHATPPADRTAAHRPTRAETEHATRTHRHETPRDTLRAHVQTAAAGATCETDFFTRLRETGVLVRYRYSERQPDEITGYALALPGHTNRQGQPVWFGGGKLAADLSLPKLRTRWTMDTAGLSGRAMTPAAARAALRAVCAHTATTTRDESDYFQRLDQAGVLVRYRYSKHDPSQVTGYALALPHHTDTRGQQIWHAAGRLAPELSLPRLRRHWATTPTRSITVLSHTDRDAIYRHAAHTAHHAATHIRTLSAPGQIPPERPMSPGPPPIPCMPPPPPQATPPSPRLPASMTAPGDPPTAASPHPPPPAPRYAPARACSPSPSPPPAANVRTPPWPSPYL